MGVLIAVYALIAFGILLCFVGKFPGQVLAYAAMLIANFNMHTPYPTWVLVVCGIAVVGSIVLNKTLVPKMAAQVHEFGKAGRLGTIFGSILSIICAACVSNTVVMIILLLVLPYVLSFVFEAISQKSAADGAKRATGAYTLFAASTLLNVAICAFCFYEIVYGKF